VTFSLPGASFSRGLVSGPDPEGYARMGTPVSVLTRASAARKSSASKVARTRLPSPTNAASVATISVSSRRVPTFRVALTTRHTATRVSAVAAGSLVTPTRLVRYDPTEVFASRQNRWRRATSGLAPSRGRIAACCSSVSPSTTNRYAPPASPSGSVASMVAW